MIEEAVYVGVDVAKSALDVAVTDSGETWQLVNDDEGISQAELKAFLDAFFAE